MTTRSTTHLNGWDVTAVAEAIQGIEETPEAGRLTWKSRVVWDGHFGMDVKVEEIEQLGQGLKRHYTLRGDHPPELLGENTGPTAVELVIGALGACMAGTFAAQATARGVEIRSMEVALQGDIDLNGFFGIRPIPPGLTDVQLAFRVDSDADQATLQEILEAARTHSPVHDTVTKPVAVNATVTKG